MGINGIIKRKTQAKRGSFTKVLINKVKQGDCQAYIELYNRFKPLIIAWLKQSKELYQKEREDYESTAKMILYECAMNFDEGRGVPFESYYKIKLYHWYANHKKKKLPICVELQEIREQKNDIYEQILEQREKKSTMCIALNCLTESERDIILRIMEGFTEEQIASEYGLCRKTVQNKKYAAISKMKKFIQENFQ